MKKFLTIRFLCPRLRSSLETSCDARSGIFHNPGMATTLSPVDSREVVRCDQCHLVQFRTNSGLGRKCRTSLDDEPEPVITQPVAVEPAPTNGHGNGHLQVAFAIQI